MQGLGKLTVFAVLFFCVNLMPIARAEDANNLLGNIEKQYQNCSEGYYSGPRPGRVRFTKDQWLWVVTEEFAKQHCMPSEFISNELKGAEAVAFKILSDKNEEICGFGGNPNICNSERSLRFEVYIKSTIDLQKMRNVPYFNPATLPSLALISRSEKAMNDLDRSVHAIPRLGALGIFAPNQVILRGVQDDKITWPVTPLLAKLFYADVFKGMDFIAFQGRSGSFRNSRMEKQNIRHFVISFKRANLNETTNANQNFSEFSHIIALPESFTERIRILDKKYGANLEELGKQAFTR